MKKPDVFEVIATAIVVKDGKFLLTRRSLNKKRFPGMWSVPGGHLELEDYKNAPTDKKGYWREVLEVALRREVKEETGLEIQNIEYITSCATIFSDGIPSIVISCMAEYLSGEIVLQKDEADKYAWARLEDLKLYHMLDGLQDEIILAAKKHEEKNKKELPETAIPWRKPKPQTLFL